MSNWNFIQKEIRNSMYAGWLGISLALFTNITYIDWQWYVIVIPTIILVLIKGKS